MTAPRPDPIFHVNGTPAALAALSTLTVVGAAVVFTDARCVCHGKIMAIPGIVQVEVRILRSP